MNCLLLNDNGSDLGLVLEGCGAALTRMTFRQALSAEISGFDCFCVLGDGTTLDPRLRVKLERECFENGKRVFAQALKSFGPIYCAGPADTVTRRLVCVCGDAADGIPGLPVGALLDDGANGMVRPYQNVPGVRPLLVYRERLVAHARFAAAREEILRGSDPGLWLLNGNLMMASFQLQNFRRARFAPVGAWDALIRFIVEWLTGRRPETLPAPALRFGPGEDLSEDAAFERCRKAGVERGVRWLERYLVDGGSGGIREGLRHNVHPDGAQDPANAVRTDCTGEAAGAFRFYGALTGSDRAQETADRLYDFVFGPMTVHGGPFDGMLRWTDEGWGVCYQDDAARALLPALYECLLLGRDERFPAVCRALDFLVKTTARDGCRVPRTDMPFLDEAGLRALGEAAHGLPSAHYNAYYHAALLLAYLHGGNKTYLETAERGLETLMALYPDTKREQSETQEMCRLIFPLAVLYRATGKRRHREMLYRVTQDLLLRRHPGGGFREWDTGYKAACARTAAGECSLLTENGDPVADLLYSVNWLPIGFAVAYRVTGDRRFYGLWCEVCAFCLNAQVLSPDTKLDGSWCRAFDLDLREAYGCPHDAGWGPLCSESGWTDAEILMGLMLPELFERKDNARSRSETET